MTNVRIALKKIKTMANYTFTSSSCYDLATHEVSFTDKLITIKLSATGKTVYTKAYGTGLAFMCQGNDFCVGRLTDNGVFSKTIDLDLSNANLWIEEKNNANHFIGSDNDSDPVVSHSYNLNQCPVRLIDGPSKKVDIECPCESSSGPCDNACYKYGN